MDKKPDGKLCVLINDKEWGPYNKAWSLSFSPDGSALFYAATRTKPSYYRIDRVKVSLSFEQASRRIAVLRFEATGNIPKDRERSVEDNLIAALVGREGFKVVERTQVEKVLKEQEFAWSGVVDQATAARLGKLLGVEYVIFGSLTGV